MSILEFTPAPAVPDQSRLGHGLGGASLEIDLLKTFAAIVETGSFNRAAKAVFRTPSAVSMQMKRLEDLIGRSIFVKDGRGVTLTADGHELLGFSHRILNLADEALMKFRCATTEGIVRLGTPDDYAAGFLPPILARFAKTHPLVQVDVTCHQSDAVIKLLNDGEIDVALVSAGANGPAQMVVHRERLVWAGLRDGTAYQKRPLPLAVSNPNCSWRYNSIAALEAAGIAHRIAYSSYQFLGQIAAITADLAIAPLAASTLTGDLIEVGQGELPQLGHFEIDLRRAAMAKGPAVEALCDHIQQSFRQLAITAAA